jgi:hypothetical protein
MPLGLVVSGYGSTPRPEFDRDLQLMRELTKVNIVALSNFKSFPFWPDVSNELAINLLRQYS